MRREPQKLVRDRIPDLIRTSGRTCGVTQLDLREYRQALRAKLQEEAEEAALAAPDDLISELADLSEVIDALLATYDISPQTLHQVQQQRREQRGGFQTACKLLWVEEEEAIDQ